MINIEFLRFNTYCKEQLGLSEHSLRAYKQDLTAFTRFLHATQISGPPAPELLVEYHQHLREEKQSSPATIRRRFITLRSYYKWLEGERNGARSPFYGLRLDLNVPRRLPRPIDRPTLTMLFKASRNFVEIDPAETGSQKVGNSSAKTTALVARLLSHYKPVTSAMEEFLSKIRHHPDTTTRPTQDKS